MASPDDAEWTSVRVRALNDARPRASADFVLYWMQMYRRPDDNAALASGLSERSAASDREAIANVYSLATRWAISAT